MCVGDRAGCSGEKKGGRLMERAGQSHDASKSWGVWKKDVVEKERFRSVRGPRS